MSGRPLTMSAATPLLNSQSLTAVLISDGDDDGSLASKDGGSDDGDSGDVMMVTVVMMVMVVMTSM